MKKRTVLIISLSVLILILFIFANKVIFNKNGNGLTLPEVVNDDTSIKMYNTFISLSDMEYFNNVTDPTIHGIVSDKSYVYHIKDGLLTINGVDYLLSIAEDGVLLIYDNNNSLVAKSKEALVSSTDYYNNTNYTKAAVELFKRRGKNVSNATHSEEDLRAYARSKERKYAQYANEDFNSEDYKYLEYAISENYMGVDKTTYSKKRIDEYNSNFIDIVFDIGMKTVFLLDKKVQDAYDDGKNVTVTLYKNGQYLVNADYDRYSFSEYGASKGGFGIVVPGGVKLDLNGSTIKQISDYTLNRSNSNYENRYLIIRIFSGDNITITNGILVGDRSERSYSLASEVGHGIRIYATDNVNNLVIDNMVIKYFSGDAISITRAPRTNGNLSVSNINIRNNYIYALSRQGISISSVDSINIDNNVVYNIIGTSTGACVDVEPSSLYSDSATDYGDLFSATQNYADNVVFSNNIFNNFKTVNLLNTIKDVIFDNNTIMGKLSLRNTDGIIDLKNNYIGNNKFINDIPEGMDIGSLNETIKNHIVIGLEDGAYNTNLFDGKRKPDFVRLYNNDIDIDKISFYYYSWLAGNNR
jgi:hypothetical protein